MMKTVLNFVAATVWFLITASAASNVAAQTTALRVGVLPNVSARVILNGYQPVRTYLERHLNRPVEIVTATDFRDYHARTIKGEYDVVVTAPNLGRVAQLDAGFVPLAFYEPSIPGLAVTLKGGSMQSIQALRGKVLAMSNPQSLIALRAFAWLKEQGVSRGEYKVVQVRNDDSLGQVLRSGEAPIAIMSAGEFRQIGEAMRADLVVNEFVRVPGFLLMANASTAGAVAERVRELFLALPNADEGKQFAELMGVRNIRAIAPGELESLNPYVDETRASLTGAR